jgi:hypothetical protein
VIFSARPFESSVLRRDFLSWERSWRRSLK